MAMRAEAGEDIVVTSSRVRKAVQEELGDFKLYRIPDRTTVASQAQKQVALLEKQSVPLRVVYVSEVYGESVDDVRPVLRAQNRTVDGLGVPLPAGQVAVFQNAGSRPVLIGMASTDDKAIGEEVEFTLQPTPGVSVETDVDEKKWGQQVELSVSNANPWPVRYEATIDPGSAWLEARGLGRKDGKPLWTTTVPANGAMTLKYALRQRP
jgi:hypothetical protein